MGVDNIQYVAKVSQGQFLLEAAADGGHLPITHLAPYINNAQTFASY